METIYLAGGCLWGVQAYVKTLPGVVKTEAGRANGSTQSLELPYDGYAECVKATFDPDVIDVKSLMAYFFEVIDPYSLNKQGEDVGPKYRTGVYSDNVEHLEAVKSYIQARDDFEKVVVEVLPLSNYIKSAEEHQDRLDRCPNDYCHIPSELLNKYKNGRFLWLGGSPCSGKSTIAEKLVEEFGFEYYKCDDFLDDYMRKGAELNIPVMQFFKTSSLDDIWLRGVETLVEDEFEFYRQAFQFIKQDLSNFAKDKTVVVEGAALLPELAKQFNMPLTDYVAMVPTPEFQVNQYSKRNWVQGYLNGCTNPDLAFMNWMHRDIAFAEKVAKDAETLGYNVIVVDGEKSIDVVYDLVKSYLKL